MASQSPKATNAAEIDRLALALAKEPGSKAFMPLAEEYGKVGMWQEAAAVLEDGLKAYPNFITAMVALGRTYDQLNQPVKAKAILEEAVKLSPENLRAHRTLAKIYVIDGAKEAALRSCAVILAVNSQDQEALSIQAGFVTAESTAGVPRLPGHVVEKDPPEQLTIQGLTAKNMSQGLVMRSENALTAHSASVHEEADPQITAMSSLSLRRDAHRRRLEHWLAAIQARRRSHASATSTS
jgi:tetratricopeptide (TPR) repeat protein